MARNRGRQLIAGISVLWLAALTALACYATYLINKYSLPLATSFSAVSIALPPLAGIAFEAVLAFGQRGTRRSPGSDKVNVSEAFQTLNTVLLVLEAVLATLAGTHLASASKLWCPLHETWKRLYVAKDARRIQNIQDGFNCCGFNSPRDMAFPFPGGTRGADACLVRYDRQTSCVGPLTALERKVAVMLLVVPIGVFLWRLAICAMLQRQDKNHHLPSAVRLPIDQGEAGAAADPADPRDRARPLGITFQQPSYSESLRDEVSRLNQDSTLASHVEGSRAVPEPRSI